MDGADTPEWNAEFTEVKELGKIAPMMRLHVVASCSVQANDSNTKAIRLIKFGEEIESTVIDGDMQYQ